MYTAEMRAALADPSVSNWLKKALRDLVDRDAVDATADAELLARFMRARLDAIQPRGKS